MSGQEAAHVAGALHEARRQARRIEVDVAAVTSVAEAYAVQAELIRLSAGNVRGWKVTALSPADQAKFGVTQPVAGALLDPWIQNSPDKLALSRFIAPVIECEIAFLLGADLPAQAVSYTRTDVEGAIAAVVPAFEFPDGRTDESSPNLLKLADVMNNGAFTLGTPLRDWRGLDLTQVAITLWRDDEVLTQGSGGDVPGGDPVMALVALANAQPLPAHLRAGQIVTTGTCTPPLPVKPGTYRASFEGLGEILARFDG